MRKEWTLFLTFLKIGAFTFGGEYAMIALLENEFVEKKKWLEKSEFLDMVAVAEGRLSEYGSHCRVYTRTGCNQQRHIHRLQNCRLVRCCGGYRGGLYSFVYCNFLHLTVF